MLQHAAIRVIRFSACAALLLTLAACSSNNWWDQPSPRYGSGSGSDIDVEPITPRSSSQRHGTYVVRPGYTLYRVAREENIPIRSLIEANNLQPPYALRSGQHLIIPSARFHVVRRGDTVYSISRTYGVDMATLTRTNHMQHPYTIKLGQKLLLPSKVNSQVASASSETPSAPSVPERRPVDANYPAPAASLPKAPLPAPPTIDGDFVWPAQGRIISSFGAKENGMHNDGINIALPAGTPVKAAQSGVVAYAGNELKGYGNLLLVRHANGWMTAYAHNSKLLVKRGDTVMRGQTISLAGSTGSVTSSQLHFEVRKGAKAVDPRSVIGS